jgi:hypothetical protein
MTFTRTKLTSRSTKPTMLAALEVALDLAGTIKPASPDEKAFDRLFSAFTAAVDTHASKRSTKAAILAVYEHLAEALTVLIAERDILSRNEKAMAEREENRTLVVADENLDVSQAGSSFQVTFRPSFMGLYRGCPCGEGASKLDAIQDLLTRTNRESGTSFSYVDDHAQFYGPGPGDVCTDCGAVVRIVYIELGDAESGPTGLERDLACDCPDGDDDDHDDDHHPNTNPETNRKDSTTMTTDYTYTSKTTKKDLGEILDRAIREAESKGVNVKEAKETLHAYSIANRSRSKADLADTIEDVVKQIVRAPAKLAALDPIAQVEQGDWGTDDDEPTADPTNYSDVVAGLTGETSQQREDRVNAFNAQFAKSKKAKGTGAAKAALTITEDVAAFFQSEEKGFHQFTVHPDGSTTYGDKLYKSPRAAGIAAGCAKERANGKLSLNPWKEFKVSVDGVSKPLGSLREGYVAPARKPRAVKAKDPAKIADQIAKAEARLDALRKAQAEVESAQAQQAREQADTQAKAKAARADELKGVTKKTLSTLAKDLGIAGRSKLGSDELIAKIVDAEFSQAVAA